MDFFDFKERGGSGVEPEIEELAQKTIGAAIEVHRHLGPGLPESAYLRAMCHELTLRGIEHDHEVPVPILYKGILVGEGRVDLLVGKKLVVELKVVEVLTNVHRAQVIAYLQALKLPLGLLTNFNVAILRDGLKRVINTF